MATPAQRRAAAQVAAHTRWANEEDRKAAMQPALRGQELRFAREVDPDGVLTPEELATRIENAKAAHMARMRLARARKANQGRTAR